MEIRLLGPVEMVVHGVPVDLGPPRQRAVLAAIAAEAGEPVQVETVIDRVWGAEPPDQVRQTLYAYVARIRRVLDRTAGVVAPLNRRSRGYVLAVDPDRVDLHRFRSLVDRAREPNRTDEERATLLREALDLWRGPALTGLPDGDWVTRAREGYRQRRLDAAVCWAQVEMVRGQPEKTIGTLIDLVAEYPYAESLVGLLMLALDANGRPADALDWFHRSRARLAEDLGTDPGPDLTRAYQTILRRTPTAPSGTSPADPAPRPTPPIAPGEGSIAPAQLPSPATGFAGRCEYLRRLNALVPAPTEAAATIVITGMAGVGKTALAVRWGCAARERFPGGQLFADLHGYADRVPARPVEVLAAFLTALGVPAARVPDTVDASAALFRTLLADRPPVLVVLDNVSHPDQVRPLRPAGSGSLTLVTSRDSLSGLVARDGAYRLDLGLLAPDEARAVLSGILARQAVPADNTALEALAIHCGRLPLALRIAAANVLERGAAGIDGYLAELAHDRLTGLQVDGDGDAAVRVAFDLSYTALPAATRELFRLLAYAPGADFTAPAAAALAGAPTTDTATRLRRLTVAHLVSEPLPGRYALHDLLRLYAAERSAAEVTADGRGAAQVRLLDWYRDMANAADRMLRPAERPNFPAADGQPPFVDAAEALAWLDAEAANLAAAVESYATARPAHAWRIAAAMYGWLQRRHRRAQWVALYEVAAEAAARAAEPAGEAMVVGRLAVAYGQLGDTERAADCCHRAYRIRLAMGDQLGAATALLNLAAVHVIAGRPEEAIARLAEAETLSVELPDTTFLTTLIHSNFGEAHHLAGRLELAFTHYNEAMARAEKAGSTRDLAHILLGLGGLLRDMGDLPAALDHCERGIDLAREAGDEILTAEAHEQLGHIHAAGARDPAARRRAACHLRAALAVYEAKGHRNTDQLRRLLAVDAGR